jgi:hypothetical protein
MPAGAGDLRGRVRRTAVTLGGVAAVSAALVAPTLSLAPPAHAAEPQFRYWTYWTGTADGWQFSPVGPAFRDAQEGVVEGWRLAVTGVTATTPPRELPGTAFADVCGGRSDSPDTVRVAIVIDFGTPADAPTAEQPPAAIRTCVEVDDGASGFDALRDVVDIRSERGLICGLAGYPRTGCAEHVEPAATQDDAGAGGTRPEPSDQDAGPDRAPAREGAGDSAGAVEGSGPEDTAPPTPTRDPAAAGAPATGNPDTSGANGSDAEASGTDGEVARAAGDGDVPTPSDEPTYPATGSGTGPEGSAAPTGGAVSGEVGGESPLRSPWLVVPVLVLIAVLGGTAWRRSRTARASGAVD